FRSPRIVQEENGSEPSRWCNHPAAESQDLQSAAQQQRAKMCKARHVRTHPVTTESASPESTRRNRRSPISACPSRSTSPESSARRRQNIWLSFGTERTVSRERPCRDPAGFARGRSSRRSKFLFELGPRPLEPLESPHEPGRLRQLFCNLMDRAVDQDRTSFLKDLRRPPERSRSGYRQKCDPHNFASRVSQPFSPGAATTSPGPAAGGRWPTREGTRPGPAAGSWDRRGPEPARGWWRPTPPPS